MVRISIILFFMFCPGNTLLDLQSKDSNFIAEASTWIISKLVSSNKHYLCEDVYLLGGYNILNDTAGGQTFKKTYTGLPPHISVYISLKFWILDNWNSTLSGNAFRTEVDGNYKIHIHWDHLYFPSNKCGSSYPDLGPTLHLYHYTHTASTITIQIMNALTEGTLVKSFGFRELNMTFSNTTASNNSCQIAPIAVPKIGPAWLKGCSCQSTKEYQSPPESGNCYPCDSTCATCNGSSPNNCLTCYPGWFMVNNNTCSPDCNYPLIFTSNSTHKFCSSPCPSNTFLYRNRTCSTTCNSPPYLIKIIGNIKLCQNPCATNEYLLWNRSCSDDCLFPLISVNESRNLFCNYPCSDSQYLFYNGTCSTECNSPFSNKIEGGKKYCYNPCNSNQFLYWNGSCLDSCYFPLQITTNIGTKYCNYICNENQYLYWNGSCLEECADPYKIKVEANRKYCNILCNENQYLYWNQSCKDECALPYKPRREAKRNYCDFPCINIDEYLFWDGSCVENCMSPYKKRIENSKSYCDLPCPLSQYLYDDMTCLDSCVPPMILKSYNGCKICERPCLDKNMFYFPEDHICKSDCPPSSIIHETSFYTTCSPKIESNYNEDPTVISLVTNIANKVAYVGCFAVTIISPGNPFAVISTSLSKLIHHLQFTNISYSARLEFVFESKFDIEIIPMSEYLNQSLGFYPLPYVFEEHNIKSNFLVNFWTSLINLAIMLGLLILMFLLGWVANKYKSQSKVSTFLKKFNTFYSNFFLGQFICTFGDIVLFSGIELRSNEFDSLLDSISVALAILFVIIVCAFLAIHLKILRGYQRLQKRVHDSDAEEAAFGGFNQRNKKIQLLFSNYKSNKFIQQAFLLFFVIREILISLVLILLFEYPLLQAMINITFNALMFLYLGVVQPFKLLFDLLQPLALELIVLIANLSFLSLHILDNLPINQNDRQIYRYLLSEVIIYCYLLLNVIAAIFPIAKLVLLINFYFSSRKSNLVIKKLKLKKRKTLNIVKGDENRVETIKDNTTSEIYTRKHTNTSHINLKSKLLKSTKISLSTLSYPDYMSNLLSIQDNEAPVAMLGSNLNETSFNSKAVDNKISSKDNSLSYSNQHRLVKLKLKALEYNGNKLNENTTIETKLGSKSEMKETTEILNLATENLNIEYSENNNSSAQLIKKCRNNLESQFMDD